MSTGNAALVVKFLGEGWLCTFSPELHKAGKALYVQYNVTPEGEIVGGCIYLLYLVLFWVIMKIDCTKGMSQPFAILAYP